MNPGIGNALSAIARIQGRIGELEARFGAPPARVQAFTRAIDRAEARHGQAEADHGHADGAKAHADGTKERPAIGPLSSTPPGTGGTATFRPIIVDAAGRNGVDPALVRAVMAAESGGNPGATSPVGAMGLMQLMPGTAKDLGVANAYDPRQNIEGGTKYLAALTKRFGVERGVAAYNAGPGAVEKYDGVPPYRETKAYVERVMRLYGEFSKEAQP